MPDSQLAGDLQYRIHTVNQMSLRHSGHYVLAILNRALRADDNPVIDAAVAQAQALGIGLLVYSELDETLKYASDRLFYFAMGAFRELSQRLETLGIPSVQCIRKAGEADPLVPLVAEAAAIYMDEDFTVWDRAKMERVVAIATQTVFAVDAARLVPVRHLPAGLYTTPAFRKAHVALRDHYAALRRAVPPLSTTAQNLQPIEGIPSKNNFAHHSDAELKALIAQYRINHDLPIAAEHPPTQAEIQTRLAQLKTHILPRYKWIRNNPALPYSTSQLSPICTLAC